jgi:hypothetical protein
MTDVEKLIERLEQATAEQQRELLEAAFVAIHGEPTEATRPNVASAWLDRWRPFLALLDAGGFLDAAMSLVPEGWRWMAGQREFPHCRAYVENGELAFRGFGLRPNPARQWFEVTAATPALALCAAALRARKAQS